MTQEDQKLLLQDLCARLPYNVKVKHLLDTYPSDLLCIDAEKNVVYVNHYGSEGKYKIECIRPYLRSMSSMTEEECDMVEVILGEENIFDFMRNGDIILKEGNFTQVMLSRLYDYFNSIHVDYRGLIPKGLALETPEGMYNRLKK